jgi:hypothetical protein
MDDRQRRVARARLLRRTGKSYDEIRGRLGPVSDDRLRSWLRGIPRPAETHRSHPKEALRAECRRLRRAGLTYGEIAAKTGASKGSISPWVRDVAIQPDQRACHLDAARRRSGKARGMVLARRAEERRAAQRSEAATAIGHVSERELFLIGVGLYWAEGSKDKPWNHYGRVDFANSDPGLVRIYLQWLHLIGVDPADIGFTLMIHESADVPAAERWWQRQLGAEAPMFRRVQLKRHNPRPRRHNTRETYHGCLKVRVCRSGELYYAIEGWWEGLIRALRLGGPRG